MVQPLVHTVAAELIERFVELSGEVRVHVKSRILGESKGEGGEKAEAVTTMQNAE